MLYPDIETYRRESDAFDIPDFRQSNLERNCNQIFVKGPALTKDLLGKINADIVPKKTCLFGYEMNTKKILFISGLFLLFFTSFIGAIVMWFTELFDNAVLSQLVISNTSENFGMWKNPTVKALVSIYIFNYTNVEDFEAGLVDKLNVEELGPYVYDETLERVNVQFDDDMVSYQEKWTYTFRPELSKGKQSDRVRVPNVPLLAGASMTKYHNYFARLGFSSVLTGLDEKPFIKLAADSLVLGYNNDLYDISRSLARLGDKHIPEKFGLLSSKVGLQSNVYTMNTGKKGINKLGLIEKINGFEELDYWSTETCNRLQSSDGSVYPPKSVQQKQPLTYLFPSVCRSLPLVYDREVAILDGKIPAYRYVVPEDVFDSVEEKPENQCYCSMTSGECPLKGAFNVTPCNFGAPMFVSHPHFHNGDESLINGVTGLSTAKKDIQTHLDIHPTMGFIMTGKTSLQINIQVQKAYGVYQLNSYDDGLMLPIAWIQGEVSEKNLPQDFVDLVYQATYTLKGVKMALQYGFLLTALITLVCIMLVFRNRWESAKRVNSTSSRRRLQREQAEASIEEL